ncbi:MAG: hypothetical protein FGM32_07085 [Candidatus Kapabacteria bacterium]|nr:hypothetical protein [Candidatus Kapabacteria bacterium]
MSSERTVTPIIAAEAIPILRHVHIPRSYCTPMNLDPSHVSELRSILSVARSVVITTHVNPDGDAVGSALGMMHWLRARGLQCTVVLPNAAPSNLQWLPGAAEMLTYNSRADVLIADADLVIVLDLNTLTRLGELGTRIAESTAVIVNIDHHTHPQDFATLAIVNTDACSTCFLLAELILLIDGEPVLGAELAQCLYTGIMTDTGSFRFPRTTERVFVLAGLLVGHGADPVETYDAVMNQSSFGRSRLLGIALASLQLQADGRLCTMSVRRKDLIDNGCNVDDVEGFVHHTLTISGVQVGILFVEVDGEVKCSFRSKGTVYVRDLAASYGGGGHVHAAGARIRQRGFDEVLTTVTTSALGLFSAS